MYDSFLISNFYISTGDKYIVGYENGYNNGYTDRGNDNYSNGYNDGVGDGVSPVSWFGAIATGFAGFFSIQIFPGVSLSVVLAIVLVPVLIGFLLKMMKGFE